MRYRSHSNICKEPLLGGFFKTGYLTHWNSVYVISCMKPVTLNSLWDHKGMNEPSWKMWSPQFVQGTQRAKLTKPSHTSRPAYITLWWPLVKWMLDEPNFPVSLWFMLNSYSTFCVRCRVTSFHREACVLDVGKELQKLMSGFKSL